MRDHAGFESGIACLTNEFDITIAHTVSPDDASAWLTDVESPEDLAMIEDEVDVETRDIGGYTGPYWYSRAESRAVFTGQRSADAVLVVYTGGGGQSASATDLLAALTEIVYRAEKVTLPPTSRR